MRKFFSTLAVILFLSVIAYGFHKHTRTELEAMTKADLIDLVMDLETRLENTHPYRDCRTYNPLNDETGNVLSRVNNSGYANDGTLKWPNDKIFMKRNAGYANDRTLYYPNGEPFLLRNSGYADDGTIYWPNGKVLLKRNRGYANDGTINRSNESVWLLRNRGYTNDQQRYGVPVERFALDDFQVIARLTDGDGVRIRLETNGDSWELEINLLAEESNRDFTYSVNVRECF